MLFKKIIPVYTDNENHPKAINAKCTVNLLKQIVHVGRKSHPYDKIVGSEKEKG
jgi:hypothetical protein